MSSLKERLAARREQLLQDKEFTLPVVGYSDMARARYRCLPYEELTKIGARHEKFIRSASAERTGANPTSIQAEAELRAAADTLLQACVGLIEVGEDGTETPLELSWGVQAARELFDVQLADDASQREAIRAVLPATQLMLHFQEYDERLTAIRRGSDETLAGESTASSTEA